MTDYLLKEEQVKKCFKKRDKDSNKGDFGYVALVGGSLEYSGAIRLAAMANCSARSGAGVVTVAVPKSLAFLIAENVLECTVFPLSDDSFFEDEMEKLCQRYKTIAIGMGIGLSDIAKQRVEYLVKNYEGTLIVDADGLNILARMDNDDIKKCKAKLILTPHLKEFSRLTGLSIEEIKGGEIHLAKDFAKEYSCIVLLKGSTTIVSDGDLVYLVDKGCPGMATAGSGDVLSGCIAAITAYNQDDLILATAASAYICGLAGEIAQEEHSDITMIASDTAKAIENVIKGI